MSDETSPGCDSDAYGRSRCFASDRGGNNQIYMMNADGSGALTQLTDDDTFYSEFPGW